MDLTKKKTQCRKVSPQAEGSSFPVGTGCVVCVSRHQLIPVPEQMLMCKQVLRECIPSVEG